MESLAELLQPNRTIEHDGIHIANDIANKTVWDKLAKENPTHAVISAGDETAAAAKSATQIDSIQSHLKPTDVLLDYGCGYGRVAKYLLPQLELAGYIGLDSSYNMLRSKNAMMKLRQNSRLQCCSSTLTSTLRHYSHSRSTS